MTPDEINKYIAEALDGMYIGNHKGCSAWYGPYKLPCGTEIRQRINFDRSVVEREIKPIVPMKYITIQFKFGDV